jgi:hypothetical protein
MENKSTRNTCRYDRHVVSDALNVFLSFCWPAKTLTQHLVQELEFLVNSGLSFGLNPGSRFRRNDAIVVPELGTQ